MSEAKKAHWKQGKNGNFRDVVFLVPWNESNGIPLDRNMWIDCNSEENARLIAAAPDLLDALRICATQSTGPDWTPEQALAFIKQHARAAIAKATGKTQ